MTKLGITPSVFDIKFFLNFFYSLNHRHEAVAKLQTSLQVINRFNGFAIFKNVYYIEILISGKNLIKYVVADALQSDSDFEDNFFEGV